MPKILFQNYIWLTNKIKARKMTFAEIAAEFEQSSLYDGRPLTKRTFFNWREKIEDLFHLYIDYDGFNRYFITNPEDFNPNVIWDCVSPNNVITRRLPGSNATSQPSDAASPVSVATSSGTTPSAAAIETYRLRIESDYRTKFIANPIVPQVVEEYRGSDYSIFAFEAQFSEVLYRSILALGCDAELLEPQSLRRKMAEEIRFLSDIYNGFWDENDCRSGYLCENTFKSEIILPSYGVTLHQNLNQIEMKTLSLSIKRIFFDQILSGEKKVETREIRPNNANRYIYYEQGGVKYDAVKDVANLPEGTEEEPLIVAAVEYDALKLLTGSYNVKPRPYIIVEVLGADLVTLVDDSGNPITYTENGVEYEATEIDYHLGRIIEDKSNI